VNIDRRSRKPASTKQATGREFIWNFDEEARRIRAVVPGIPISGSQFEQLIATCRDLDRQDRVDARGVDAEVRRT
jgi:hypothetical protein